MTGAGRRAARRAALAAFCSIASPLLAGPLTRQQADDVHVRYIDGRLSVVARNATLGAVLEEIARQTCLHFELAPEIAALRSSWYLDDRPLRPALLELAQPYGSALSTTPGVARGTSCLTLALSAVPPRGATARASAPADDAERNAQVEGLVRTILDERNPAVRSQAIARLAALEPRDAARGLDQALAADDPAVRIEVVRARAGVLDDRPSPALFTAVLGDKDASVRSAAVKALAGLPGDASRAVLKMALQDRDEEVRRAAAEAIGPGESH